MPQPKQPKPAKRKRKSNLVVAFALLWTPAAFAQNRTQFLDVKVTDAEGRAVADLTAADFEISLDGRPQQIVDCSYITGPSPTSAAPLLLRPAAGVEKRRMVLVVDDLNLSARGADQVRQVLRRYVDQQMRPSDETVVIRSSSGSGAQQQFTDDSIHLRDAIDHIQPRHLAGPGPDAPFAIGTMGTLDLTFEGLRALPGRKSVVLFTEATPAITSAVGSLLEKANRAFAVFYAINPAGTDTMFQEAAPSAIAPRSVAPLMATGPTELPNSPLQALAKATGGLVLDRGGVASGFARVLEDRQSYYLLRYSRDFAIFRPGTGEQLVSHIAVKTVRDGLTIRTRDGFPDDDIFRAAPAHTDQRLVEALFSPFSSGGFRFGLDSLFLHSAREGPLLKLTLHVDGRDITFRKTISGVYQYGIDTAIMTLGEGRAPTVHARFHFGDAPMTEAQHQEALERGTTLEIRVLLGRPGAYQLRIALLDQMSGRAGSANRFVYLPDVASGDLTLSGIALSRVIPGEPLFATYEIYNLAHGAGNRSEIDLQIRLRRGSDEITTSPQSAIQFGPSEDPARRSVTSRINLGSSLPPGMYTLQITVTDKLTRPRPRAATQEVAFEIP